MKCLTLRLLKVSYTCTAHCVLQGDVQRLFTMSNTKTTWGVPHPPQCETFEESIKQIALIMVIQRIALFFIPTTLLFLCFEGSRKRRYDSIQNVHSLQTRLWARIKVQSRKVSFLVYHVWRNEQARRHPVNDVYLCINLSQNCIILWHI